LIPLKEKPVPEGDSCEIVSAEPPELVSVCESVLVLPVATFPKLWLAGLAVRRPGVTPVPDNTTFRVEFEPLLISARFPLTLPPDWGAKETVNVVL
jgi:hypothetical protein